MDGSATGSDRLGETAREQYLRETVRTWLGVPREAKVDPPALPETHARRLLREEELEHDHRDTWGRWEYGFCESFAEGALLVPEVDRWLAETRRRLPEGLPLEPLWPDGKPFVLCLTHDVDHIADGYTPRQALRLARAGFGATPQMPHDHIRRVARVPWRVVRAAAAGLSSAPAAADLERCAAIEDEVGVRSTYLFTVFRGGSSGPQDCVYRPEDRCAFRGSRGRVADVLQTLADEGFDVGLHGSYHSAVKSGLLTAEREELERAIGQPVTSTRQHYLHWDVRRTPRLQEEAGLRTDSTLGFNRALGFRCGTSLPFHHFDAERSQSLQLLQVPLVVHDVALFRPHALQLDATLAERLVCEVIDSVAEVGGVATISLHPNDIGVPAVQAVYRTAIAHALSRGAWAASLQEIDRWWRERERRLDVRLPSVARTPETAEDPDVGDREQQALHSPA